MVASTENVDTIISNICRIPYMLKKDDKLKASINSKRRFTIYKRSLVKS